MEMHLIKNPPESFFKYSNAFRAPIKSMNGNEYYLVAMDQHNLDKSTPLYTAEELDKFGTLKFDNNFTIKTSGDVYAIMPNDKKTPIIHNILYGDKSVIRARLKNIATKTGLFLDDCVFCVVNDYEVIIFVNKTISEIRRLIKKDYLLLKYRDGEYMEVS